MNTRILRMSERYTDEICSVRIISGLGQTLDVCFTFEAGRLTLDCEAVTDDALWERIPLPASRVHAKVTFAAFERHKALGTKTPSALLLAVLEARRLAEVRSKPRPRPHRRPNVPATA